MGTKFSPESVCGSLLMDSSRIMTIGLLYNDITHYLQFLLVMNIFFGMCVVLMQELMTMV